ncbi:hypothetical protein SAMN05880574_1408 [Chryseobacterium sp. RU37D]|nr:hypothetical protein SAMN05880574_1408 [Chryseobacterium sp. RU37D]
MPSKCHENANKKDSKVLWIKDSAKNTNITTYKMKIFFYFKIKVDSKLLLGKIKLLQRNECSKIKHSHLYYCENLYFYGLAEISLKIKSF